MAKKITKFDLPPIHGFWDRPATRAVGDQEGVPIFLAVGEASHSWELVESQFATIFTLLVESWSHAGDRVYGTLSSNGAKAAALNAAADVFFLERNVEEPYREHFALLIKHFQQAVSRRNDIIHAVVNRFIVEGEIRGYFLSPPSHSTSKTAVPGSPEFWAGIDMGHRYLFTAEDVRALTDKFTELSAWAADFAFHFWLKYPRRRKEERS
jgi:hypothetical protein